jgi:hypothetical protein
MPDSKADVFEITHLMNIVYSVINCIVCNLRVEPERGGEGQRGEYRPQIWVENTNKTEYIQEIGPSLVYSINSDKHLHQNPFNGQFF